MINDIIRQFESELNRINGNRSLTPFDILDSLNVAYGIILQELKKEDEKCCDNCDHDNKLNGQYCNRELLKHQHFNYTKELVKLTYCSNYKEVVK